MRLRTLVIAALAASLSTGCSVLDGLTFQSTPQLDPNKIYLGRSIIDAHRSELERYACVNGPLLCHSTMGVTFTCRCPL